MENKNSTPDKPEATTALAYKRVPDEQFFEDYANNVVMEPNAWDLKLIFGKIDFAKGANTVVQHSALTLPWSQVKVGIYLLQFHLAVYEKLYGKVTVPKGVINPPIPPTEDQQKENPHSRKIFEALQELFRRFSEANPEAF